MHVEWLRSGADAGDGNCQMDLADLYIDSECGLVDDGPERRRLLEAAAESGFAAAQCSVGKGVVQPMSNRYYSNSH